MDTGSPPNNSQHGQECRTSVQALNAHNKYIFNSVGGKKTVLDVPAKYMCTNPHNQIVITLSSTHWMTFSPTFPP